MVRWKGIGDVGVEVDGEMRRPSGVRPASVLAILLIRRNRVVSVEALIDAIWPDEPPATARNSIQRFVSDLRGVLGVERKRLVTEPTGYRLEVSEGELDLAVLESEVHEARSALAGRAPTVMFEHLRSLAERLEADVFVGSGDVLAVQQESIRLAALRTAVVEDATSLAAEAGLPVLAEVEVWSAMQPHNEGLAGQLMELLTRTGRSTDALAVFRRTEAALLETFGVNPSPALASLELDILRHDLSMTPPTPAARPIRPTMQLIGRDALEIEVGRALHSSPLVTLVGPGGVGKTSVAHRLVEEFSPPAGPRSPMVLLTDATTPALIGEAMAGAVGLDPLQARTLRELGPAVVSRAESQGAGLLALDNAEHVINEVAEFVDAALGASALPILVTSREPLGIPGEKVIAVEPLPVESEPGEPSVAVQLFAERGAAATSLSVADLVADGASTTICRLLNGMPLAIELAAVQLRAFPVVELAEHLERSLSLLAQPRRDDRHSSLGAVVRWSWDLLGDDERRFLALLSPFRGFTSQAADHVDPAEGIRLLSQLVSKSLVQIESTTGDRGRYSLLTSVRAFAAERCRDLDLVDVAHRRHADALLAAMRRWSVADSIGASEAHDHVETELYNAVTALDWLETTGCSRETLELMTRAGGLFSHRGPIPEGRARFARIKRRLNQGWSCPLHGIVHDDPLDRDLRGAFLTTMSSMGSASGNVDYLFGCGYEAIELIGETPFDWAVDALGTMAVATRSSDLSTATVPFLEKAERLAPLTPSAASNSAYAAIWRGSWQMMDRDYESAIASFGRALDTDARPGRNLLLAETGWLVSLHLLGRHDAAREVAKRVRSQASTDAWHHVIDVVRAIALAPTDSSQAARIIEGLLAAAPLSEFPGRQDDINIGVGVVAYWSGQPDKTVDLLSTTLGRTPATQSILMEYQGGLPSRPMSADAWQTQWRDEFGTRLTAQQTGAGWMQPAVGGLAEQERLLTQVLQRI